MGITDQTKVLFSTSKNLQKILLNDSTTVTVPVGSFLPPIIYTAFTVAVHGLGYIPTGRVFYEPTPGQVWPLQDDISVAPVHGRFYFTTNTLVVELNNTTGVDLNIPIYYRIYADADF